MKKEEIIALEKNGIDHERLQKLKKALKGYRELKKEVTKMERLVLQKDKEIEEFKKEIKKVDRKKLLDGLI